MVDAFTIRPREDCLEAAHRLYRLALQQGFTKGRRVGQVAAACLYVICRQEGKPFMLIDYSDYLQVGVGGRERGSGGGGVCVGVDGGWVGVLECRVGGAGTAESPAAQPPKEAAASSDRQNTH